MDHWICRLRLHRQKKMKNLRFFVVVERMPEPIGGMQAIYDRVKYPEIARRAGIEGRVVLQFIVDETGRL